MTGVILAGKASLLESLLTQPKKYPKTLELILTCHGGHLILILVTPLSERISTFQA